MRPRTEVMMKMMLIVLFLFGLVGLGLLQDVSILQGLRPNRKKNKGEETDRKMMKKMKEGNSKRVNEKWEGKKEEMKGRRAGRLG